MEVDGELIKHIAKTARLDLSEGEVTAFVGEFKEILDAFSKLDEIDVTGVLPSFQPIPLQDALREDEPTNCLSQDDALSCTELKKEGFFKGPRSV